MLLEERVTTDLTHTALTMALQQRLVEGDLVHHSDRGQPICGGALPAAAQQARPTVFHESAEEFSGQRDG